MPAGPLTSVGIGDDAAVVGAPSGNVVAAVDMLIEGRHFLRDWSYAYDIGVKAAARSMADIAAMGAVNTALLVALAAPGTLTARWAADLADGLAAEATRAGAGIAAALLTASLVLGSPIAALLGFSAVGLGLALSVTVLVEGVRFVRRRRGAGAGAPAAGREREPVGPLSGG